MSTSVTVQLLELLSSLLTDLFIERYLIRVAMIFAAKLFNSIEHLASEVFGFLASFNSAYN